MIVEFFPPSKRAGADRKRLLDAAHHTDDYMHFGRDYFDNPDLGIGYGKYAYDGRYADVAKKMREYYGLKPGDSVLELGCAKGFLLVEFQKLGMKVAGIDASEYAVEHAHPDLKGLVQRGDAAALPFADKSFQLIVSKEMLPHIPEDQVAKVLQECMRVSTGPIFFEIQCGTTEKECAYMKQWDPTHLTIHPPAWWNALFATIGYTGDAHFKVLISEEDLQPQP
jgi:SAM-dependent methyltransferase